jgi:hypothetical protein
VIEILSEYFQVNDTSVRAGLSRPLFGPSTSLLPLETIVSGITIQIYSCFTHIAILINFTNSDNFVDVIPNLALF